MEKIIVRGGSRLKGKVTVSGSKNAVLPIIAASLLAEGECHLYDIPKLADVATISQVIRSLGASVRTSENELIINTERITNTEAPYDHVRQMRASFLVMGPLLSKKGKARISLPGGCAIGTRPIDLHLKGFQALGCRVISGHGFIEAETDGMTGAKVYLDFPSVGATENIMMAATLAKGTTIIENAAEEPEVVDLANFLNAMGGIVRGAGTKIIKVEGVDRLAGTEHTVIPDRIEASTFMVAAAITGSEILIDNVIPDHVKPVAAKLKESGVVIEESETALRVIGSRPVKSVDIKTLPYPGFPTDMQAPFMALLTTGSGTSVVTETVFENRFMHVDELKRMGANIKIEGHTAIVKGVDNLTGAPVKATDLRAGAALILAGLVADGVTEIGCIHHVERGYENIVAKFCGLGADVRCEER